MAALALLPENHSRRRNFSGLRGLRRHLNFPLHGWIVSGVIGDISRHQKVYLNS